MFRELLARSAATKERAPLPHCADGQSRTDALQVKSISEFFGLRCVPVVLDCRCQQEQDTLLGVLRLVHRTLASSQCYAPVRCTGVLVCVVRHAATHPLTVPKIAKVPSCLKTPIVRARLVRAFVRACVRACVRSSVHDCVRSQNAKDGSGRSRRSSMRAAAATAAATVTAAARAPATGASAANSGVSGIQLVQRFKQPPRLRGAVSRPRATALRTAPTRFHRRQRLGLSRPLF
jgi:hypothetical protein